MEFPNNRVRRKAVWGRQLRLPIAVALLSVLAAGSAQAQLRVTLEWDRNADPHTAGYLVSAGVSSANYIAEFNVAAQTQAPLDLPWGGVYYVTVRGYDAQGRLGPRSAEMVIDLSSAPRDPSALRTSVSGRHATLEWNPPAGGALPLQYLVSTAIPWAWPTRPAAPCRRAGTSRASRPRT
jgi:hypothetical protein